MGWGWGRPILLRPNNEINHLLPSRSNANNTPISERFPSTHNSNSKWLIRKPSPSRTTRPSRMSIITRIQFLTQRPIINHLLDIDLLFQHRNLSIERISRITNTQPLMRSSVIRVIAPPVRAQPADRVSDGGVETANDVIEFSNCT